MSDLARLQLSLTDYNSGAPPRPALHPKDAALALESGDRLLWSETNAREFPCVRIGRAVVHPAVAHECWCADQATTGGAR